MLMFLLQGASMTLLKVEVPTGYSVDMEALREQRQISRSEMEGDNLVIYFNSGVVSVVLEFDL